MTRLDQKKETCPCQVCRSDLAYIVPCEFEDTIEFEFICISGEVSLIEGNFLEPN